ncbi:MAG: epimerase [Legionellales bacterium]|nr:epimerase [Legionellales bacterium]|tara:strand:- start:548 stop:1687 length:1140 start_codon:yes stop_codon:yes gene_type:complete
MLNIGITGSSGFIGKHLVNTLNLNKKINLFTIDKDNYNNKEKLKSFVKDCNVIIHLSSLNRHEDGKTLFDKNIEIVKKLINALNDSKSNSHVIFSSSIQENSNNSYGKSKKKSGLLLEDWANSSDGKVTSLTIPNVFGPFGKPFYNSVVATFCYQLAEGETPSIDSDNELKLIYVGELIDNILHIIESQRTDKVFSKSSFIRLPILPTNKIKVSKILNKLKRFKALYLDNAIIPDLTQGFDKNLFNTFLCYLDHKSLFPYNLKLNTDKRGSFVETMKFNSSGQVSFSTTKPGITRGNHYHTRKFERFAVIEGKALIQLRKIGSNKIYNFTLNGETPSFVDMPIWFTHNIKNIGTANLLTLFWINETFDEKDPDTYFEKV